MTSSPTQTASLAVDGGPKAKTVPYGEGERFAGNELKYLQETLAQNTLFYGHGEMVKRSCALMQEYTGSPYVVACSSGSAAIHLGLIAAGIGPGDEIIVTPNTDSGSALGIIAEGAVPVFCDYEDTLQPSARTVAACITSHTRAVLVIHLAGYPAPADEIVALCEPRGIAVVEDCAQSWGTRLHDKPVGADGVAGCYSVNDYKHLSAGDGGFVTLKDEALYRRLHNYADKHYDRFFHQSQRQKHHGLNYRMTELQGAVACAQIEQLDAITDRYHALGERLREQLQDLPGARFLEPIEGAHSTYWWTFIELRADELTESRDRVVEAIQAEGVGVSSYGGYDLVQTPLFQERVARPWLDDDRRHYPFVQPDGRSYTYSLDALPTHRRLLDCGIRIGVSRFSTDRDMDEAAEGIRKVLTAYAVDSVYSSSRSRRGVLRF